MKNRKKSLGFTLVELLAVIVILAIVTLIAVPNVNGLIKKNKEKMFCQKISSIESSAKNYAQDFYESIAFNSNNEAGVRVSVLLEKGYIKADSKETKAVTDPRSGDSLLNKIVTIKKINNRYYGSYNYDNNSDKELCSK